jgi:cytochrome c biogenesis protein CcmG, thiol:disulfide interchange protein DsbE
MPAGRRAAGVTALLGIGVAFAALLPGFAGAAAPAQAPDFTLKLLSGGTLTLDSIRGSPVILLFWAPW